MSTRTRFEKEAKGNSEMVYCDPSLHEKGNAGEDTPGSHGD